MASRPVPPLIILLGASVGVCFQALQIIGKPQEFNSIAKLVAVLPQSMHGENPSYKSPDRSKDGTDFYGTISETLESNHMKDLARERVKALYPELPGGDVEIQAYNVKGTTTFSVVASGAEPRHTKIFLDALLDEFIAFRRTLWEQAKKQPLLGLLQSLGALEKRTEEMQVRMEKARSKAESLPARAEQERLVARLSAFRNQRDDLQLGLKVLAAGEASRPPLEAKALLVDREIQTLEKATGAFEKAAAELRSASEAYALAKSTYETALPKVQQYQNLHGYDCGTDYVAIQERASPAVEYVEDWQLSVTIAAVGGGLLGALVAWLLSTLVPRIGGPPRLSPLSNQSIH